jgi:hypothetical protein
MIFKLYDMFGNRIIEVNSLNITRTNINSFGAYPSYVNHVEFFLKEGGYEFIKDQTDLLIEGNDIFTVLRFIKITNIEMEFDSNLIKVEIDCGNILYEKIDQVYLNYPLIKKIKRNERIDQINKTDI